MTKSVYLEDKKYTEIAPPGIVKQMKDRGIISERVPYDTIYIDVYGAGSWKIWLVSDSTVKKSVQITMIAIAENSHSFLDIAPLNLNLLLFNRL
jgi:hypothetical protein